MLSSGTCFCRACRLAAGAPSATWFVVPADRCVFTAGRMATFHWSPEVKRSFRRTDSWQAGPTAAPPLSGAGSQILGGSSWSFDISS